MVLGVCGVVSSITLLFPIHALHHPLVVPCVVIAWFHGVVLIDECGMSGLTVTHTERGQHTGVLVWRVVCDGVVWRVRRRVVA